VSGRSPSSIDSRTAAHKQVRAQWAEVITAQPTRCTCTRDACPYHEGQCPVILEPDRFDLGHTPDRSGYIGPECVRCNRSDGARQGNARRGAPRVTHRTWGTGQPFLQATPSRTVVALFGPPGAGKTTAARASGLRVYDRDDYTTEAQFIADLNQIGTNPHARAVVIRAGATSAARAKTKAQVRATHAYLLLAPRDELNRRISQRGRADKRITHIGVDSWLKAFDTADGIRSFPGWQAVAGVQKI